MAIKITKPGQKEFYGFCRWCGCEFSYEISDLKLSATGDKLECPCCGKDYLHQSKVQSPTIPGGTWPLQGLPIETYDDPCKGCAWTEFNRQNINYTGDTPCTWCLKNQVTCGVQSGTTLNDLLNQPFNQKLEEYSKQCNCDDNAVCAICSGTGKGYTNAVSSTTGVEND